MHGVVQCTARKRLDEHYGHALDWITDRRAQIRHDGDRASGPRTCIILLEVYLASRSDETSHSPEARNQVPLKDPGVEYQITVRSSVE